MHLACLEESCETCGPKPEALADLNAVTGGSHTGENGTSRNDLQVWMLWFSLNGLSAET